MFRRTRRDQLRRTRLIVEPLEDRRLLSGGPTPLTFHPDTNQSDPFFAGCPSLAAVIPNVQVVNIFWGSAYGPSGSLQATRKYMDRFTNYLVSSPFMDVLAQYGVGHGQYQGDVVLGGVQTRGVIQDSTIQGELQAAISKFHLPAPSLSELYMVYLPPSVTIPNEGGAGYHADQWNEFCGDPNDPRAAFVEDFDYAVITSSKRFPNNTFLASHELAEAVTDPRVGHGWYNDATFATNGGEVADLAAAHSARLHGYTVTQLYSNVADGIVKP
jgi:hypothetical protein